MPARKHQELLTAAVQRDAEAQRALVAGEPTAARAEFAEAAALYRQSWEVAPPTAYGRLVGMIKSSVLAGGGAGAADYVLEALADADPQSATAAYVRALAALILEHDEDARMWALRMGAGGDAFARTAEAIAALAGYDAPRLEAALAEIVRDFEQRTDHLTGVAIADTALVLEVLAARRGMAVAIDSPLLPALE